MKKEQLRFPGIDPPKQLRPSEKRTAPAFWVHRLRILSKLASGDDHVVRDVTLRRGLNIVWAPPHSAGADNALFKDGVAGHTAGKSTFCRLLRHILGDGGFAPDTVKRRIRATLPNGWVTAEVFVDDARWVVARPLGIGQRAFCLPDARIDDVVDTTLERHDYQEFIQALSGTTIPQLGAKNFPSTDKPVAWEHVLPWLVRDQDCRFADFLEWRHSSSGSEAPALNIEERQFLVRTVLGLISDAERRELARNAVLVAEKEDAVRLTPLLRHQADTERQRLSVAMGEELSLASTPLFASATRAEVAARREALAGEMRALDASDPRDKLRTGYEEASKQEGAARNALKNIEDRINGVVDVVSELAGSAQSSKLAALPPPRGYCGVRLQDAREGGCPLASDRPVDLSARLSEAIATTELATERTRAAGLEAERKRLDTAVTVAGRDTAAARAAFIKANTSYVESKARLAEEGSKLGEIERQIQAAESSARNAESKAESVKQLGHQIDESYALQDKARAKQRAAISRFSTVFDYVVRALIGDQVSGRVEPSGRSVSLTVDERGERESTAISTIKLLGFDLAAMVASIEGDGSFPRFLVHDGPREADMSGDVYGRLFLLARELEKCFTGEPAFQYIVTTTTKPPDEFVAQDAPWLRLELSGLSAQERFLRQDL